MAPALTPPISGDIPPLAIERGCDVRFGVLLLMLLSAVDVVSDRVSILTRLYVEL